MKGFNGYLQGRENADKEVVANVNGLEIVWEMENPILERERTNKNNVQGKHRGNALDSKTMGGVSFYMQ